MWTLLKKAFRDWKEDECPRIAAAMSYFTVFSLPPLLIIVIAMVGVFFDPSDINGHIQMEMASLIGPEGARQIQAMLRSVDRPQGPLAVALVVTGLVLGATGVFSELQGAMNRVWEVRPDPTEGVLHAMLMKRAVSLGMVLTVAFLLLVSLLVSTALSAFGEVLARWLPGDLSSVFLRGLDVALSFGVITLLFASIFAYIPDAKVAWADVWVGALGTSLLFVLGKFLLGLYFARSDPGAAFGAAGSLALIFAWVYYSAMILFFGAEFTQAWAVDRGGGIEPADGAIRIFESSEP